MIVKSYSQFSEMRCDMKNVAQLSDGWNYQVLVLNKSPSTFVNLTFFKLKSTCLPLFHFLFKTFHPVFFTKQWNVQNYMMLLARLTYITFSNQRNRPLLKQMSIWCFIRRCFRENKIIKKNDLILYFSTSAHCLVN